MLMKTLMRFTLGCLAAAIIPALQAQSNFDPLDWSTLDGGGGTCAGGAYRLSGTIGQPDAGVPMSGGMFTITGGFWPGITGGSVGPIPALSIRLGTPVGGVNTVILSWPNPSTGYVLQQTANMSAPSGGWTEVNQPPVVVGSNKEVAIQATGSVCFFRLRRL
jgi:hypothetical protein